MKQLTITAIKNKLRKHYNELVRNPATYCGPFEQRIKQRHITFWSAPDAEDVRNTPMAATDPLAKWKDVYNWQRRLSNKHNAREFAKMHGCQVPELYWKGRDVHAINFDAFPERFVIRPTIGHSSDLVFLMDGWVNLMDKQAYSAESIREVLDKALQNNPYLEFLVEEFLRDEKGMHRIPDDYKFYMFNGHVSSIQVINRLGPASGFDSCYDENWKQIPNISTYYPQATYQQPPRCLPELLNQAKRLSKSYETFVRVDFYSTDKGPVFGEFTPTPGVGRTFTPEAEKMYITYWDRYCAGMI
jgi:hypothetical protein